MFSAALSTVIVSPCAKSGYVGKVNAMTCSKVFSKPQITVNFRKKNNRAVKQLV